MKLIIESMDLERLFEKLDVIGRKVENGVTEIFIPGLETEDGEEVSPAEKIMTLRYEVLKD